MIIADISISFGGSTLLLLLFSAILIALAYFFYRFTLPPLPSRTRLVFSVLRSVALVLLLLVFFEPIIRLIHNSKQPPQIAVLIDNSQSMAIHDAAGDRAEQLKAFLGRHSIHDISSEALVKYYSSSTRLHALEAFEPESLQLNGETTNLSDAFSSLKTLLTKENIQAAVLISDGIYNAGKNPIYDAAALGIPVYTVGIGDTNEQKDILIEKIATNNIAYAETRIPVDATIKSSGYDGERVEVTLADGASIIDTKTIILGGGIRQHTVRMQAELKEEGTKKLTVTISKLSGELTEKNNTRSLFIKVLKNKLRIFLLAGAPNPDVTIVRQILEEDGHFSLHTLIQKSVHEFYEGTKTQTAIDSTDCFILIGFPSSATDSKVIDELRNHIVKKKKPLFFLNSKTTDYDKLQMLESLLPFTWSAVSSTELLTDFTILDRNKHHPLIELEHGIVVDTWLQLPPLYKAQTVFRSKPESEILAAAVVQHIPMNEPLILVRNINRQKSFAITGYGLWQWNLLAQGNSQTETFLPAILSNTIRWLTSTEDNKRVRVIAMKEIFTTAEPTEFVGQVYDEEFRPVDNAEVQVLIEHNNQKLQFALNAVGNGLYEGVIEGLGEGDYSFVGTATRNGNFFGDDKGKLTIGQANIEFLETRMNNQLLEQLAYRTGGVYYHADNASTIAKDINNASSFEIKTLVEVSEIELWNWKYVALIIVALFCIEWFLRKRNGML